MFVAIERRSMAATAIFIFDGRWAKQRRGLVLASIHYLIQISGVFLHTKKILRHIMLNMNERMNESLFNLNYKIISIVRLFNFTRSAILPHNLPKLYSTGRFSWSTICYCAGGRGLKVLNGTRPVVDETLDHWADYRSSRAMIFFFFLIYVQFCYRCPCYNYNYHHSIKRAGRFLGVA